MRRIRYLVAMSLDGYIADANGGYAWITQDPEIDFTEMYARFDTLLMGRKTYEVVLAMGDSGGLPGKKIVVVSKSLNPADHPAITVLNEDIEAGVAALRAEPGQDIWLFGGGVLFRDLLRAGLVDAVEVAVIPILLGGGIPMLATPAPQTKLTLIGRRVYEQSGIVSLEYVISPGSRTTPPAGDDAGG